MTVNANQTVTVNGQIWMRARAHSSIGACEHVEVTAGGSSSCLLGITDRKRAARVTITSGAPVCVTGSVVNVNS